jgi:NAD(P)-dependent dehydrogenase (short-subunit alcohol dehydrogenase family)
MPTALVTGASTGIGLATAVTLARAGHKVYATMRNPARGAGEITSIAEAEKLPLTVLPLDVDSDQSVRDVFAKTGEIDVLVNNAGIAIMSAVEDMPLEEFRRIMETNYFGALRCIQAVLPGMRERRSGCIVNVSSVAGRIAGGAQGAYAASKWALEALSESLAYEVRAFGIRVAIVEPGVIATPIFGKMEEEKPSAYPQKRRLEAYFRGSLKNPVSPYVVAETIRGIVESYSWQLRYPAGPDAVPVLAARAHVSDEEWVASGAVSDEEWAERIERGLGVKLEW